MPAFWPRLALRRSLYPARAPPAPGAALLGQHVRGVVSFLYAPRTGGAYDRGRTYRLGFLLPSARQSAAVEALFHELRLNGFVEGKNLTVVPGGFEATDDNLVQRAAALVSAAPDAIMAGPAPPLQALQAQTRSIPIVGMSEDMVAEGLVASLARPGGNMTGISLLSPELDGKRQDILIEAVPAARRIAAMADSRNTPPYHLQALDHAARSRGVELSVFGVNGPEEIASAIDAAKAAGAAALNFLASPLFSLPGTRNNTNHRGNRAEGHGLVRRVSSIATADGRHLQS